MIKKNMKLIIGLMIGIILPGIVVYGVNTLNASSISIDKTNMNKVPESNLESALDYLYSKSKTTNMITIESGVLHDTQTYLGIAYLAPTNLSIKCTAANSISDTGYKGEIDSSHSGCMKWYIYKDLGNSYKLILDHNTTASQAWNTVSDEQHPYGTNVEFKADNGNLAYNELQNLVSATGWVVEPDLISAAEVAEIVGYPNFSTTNAWFYFDSKNQTRTNTREGTSRYAWLFDNLGWSDWGCTSFGCNVNNATGDNISAAYWTKTPYGTAGGGSAVWLVARGGRLGSDVAHCANFGLRPVITISKSLF